MNPKQQSPDSGQAQRELHASGDALTSADFAVTMREAHELLRAGRGEEAAGAFKRALALDPGNDAANIGLAYALKRLGRLADASAVFEGVIDRKPTHDGALIGLGYTRRELGDDAGALEALTRASELAPDNVAIAVEVGSLASRLGKIDNALAAFDRALASEPKHFTANVSLARLLKSLSRSGDALAAFEIALSVDAAHKGVRVERAHLLRELGRLEDAATACRGVLEEDDGYSPAWIALGWTLRKMGHLTEAEAAFRAVLAREPGHLGALTALGHIASDTARVEEASDMFASAVRADPLNASLRLSCGHIARRRRDRLGALASFAVAAVLEPARVEPLLEVAAELRDLGRAEEAHGILDLVEAKARRETGERLSMARGLILRSQNRRQAALETFLGIAAREPANTAALVEAARECRALGRPDEARRLIDRVFAAVPDEPNALLLSAELAFLAEDFADVLALCQRGLATAPEQIWFYLNAARASAGLGDAHQADAFLVAARERFGDQPELIAMAVEIDRQRRDWPAAQRRLAAHPRLADDAFWLWAQRVGLAISLGDFAEAETALRAPPAATRAEHARVQLLRGQLSEAQRDYDAALAAYRRSTELDPSDGWSFAELARALLISLELDEAQAALRRSSELNLSVNILRGVSTKASQSHLGQLLDDFTLDGALIEPMKAACRLPPAQKVASFAEIVREAPDSMAASLLGILSLRQAGHFDRRPQASAGDRPIPRRIVQFWNAPDPPDDIVALMASWRDLNASYEYTHFDDERAYRFLEEGFPAAVARAFERSAMPAQRADLLRLAVLAQHGGFYMDADDRALAPIDALVPAASELFLYQESYGSIGNNVLGAAPGHPVITRALDAAVAAINRGDKDIVWLSTGPGLLTRAFAQQVFASEDIAAALEGVCVLELGEIQRSVGFHCPVRYKATDRHWSRAVFSKAGARATRAARPRTRPSGRAVKARLARQLP